MTATGRGLDRRAFLASAAMASAGGVLLSACGGDGGSGGSDDGGYDGEMAVVHLNDILNNVPFLVADRLDYFKDAGITGPLVGFTSGTDTIRAILTGMELGSSSPLELFTGSAAGVAGVHIVGSVFNTAAVSFIVPVDSPIQSVRDLAGKKIGTSRPGSNSTYFAETIVREEGYRLNEDVQIVPVGGAPDSWTAAKSGIVDVAWTTSPIVERLDMAGEARVVWRASDYFEPWSDTVLLATDRMIEDNPDAVRAWIGAIDRAMADMENSPDAAAEVYADIAGIDVEVAKRAFATWPEGTFSTKLNRPGLERVIAAGLDTGQLEEEPDLDALVVTEFTG